MAIEKARKKEKERKKNLFTMFHLNTAILKNKIRINAE